MEAFACICQRGGPRLEGSLQKSSCLSVCVTAAQGPRQGGSSPCPPVCPALPGLAVGPLRFLLRLSLCSVSFSTPLLVVVLSFKPGSRGEMRGGGGAQRLQGLRMIFLVPGRELYC